MSQTVSDQQSHIKYSRSW